MLCSSLMSCRGTRHLRDFNICDTYSYKAIRLISLIPRDDRRPSPYSFLQPMLNFLQGHRINLSFDSGVRCSVGFALWVIMSAWQHDYILFERIESYRYFFSNLSVFRIPSSSGCVFPSNSIPIYPLKPEALTIPISLL